LTKTGSSQYIVIKQWGQSGYAGASLAGKVLTGGYVRRSEIPNDFIPPDSLRTKILNQYNYFTLYRKITLHHAM